MTIDLKLDFDQFQTLSQALKEDTKDVEQLVLSTPTSGTVKTKDVTLGFAYNEGTLVVTMLQANSFLARHASDSTIESHISQLLTKFIK